MSASKRLIAIIAAALSIAGMAEAGTDATRLVGQWGGPQALLTLTPTGGTLALACASATIDAPVQPDATGRFSVAGRYEDYSGGPTPADKPVKSLAVRFLGHSEGDMMHLSVHPSGAPASEYRLERGRRTKLIRCQ